MSPQLDDIAYRAKAQPAARFTALAHHLTEKFLEDTWQNLNHRGRLDSPEKPWRRTGVNGDAASRH